jgi:D-sedoheptulose 7-phosphate isomerase
MFRLKRNRRGAFAPAEVFMGIADRIFDEHAAAAAASRDKLAGKIEQAAALIVESYRRGNKVVLFGNGGSAADAVHIEGELLCRFRLDRAGLPAVAVGSGLSALTAAANDYSYEEAMAHLVRAHVKPGDVAVAISTSGDSPNIVNAAKAARDAGATVIAMTGETGGLLKEHARIVLDVPSRETPRIQEVHAVIGHILCDIVEQELFGGA